MPSFTLFITCVSILSFSAGLTQESDLIQDFDPPTDNQQQDFLNFQNLGLSQGAELPNLKDSSFTDTVGSDFGDSSLFTDMEIADFNDPTLSSGILVDASCSNDDGIRPGKLRAREGRSCVNPSASNPAAANTKPSTSNTGDAVGVMTSESYWCVDPQFALYHTVAVCDQLHTGVQEPSGYHWVVYPSSLSKFRTLPQSPLLHP